MPYQPKPFSLIMPEVPAYITDGEIAHMWDVAGRKSVRIRSIQLEPCCKQHGYNCLQHGDYNRVTIHFDDFNGYGIALKESIMNGYYLKYRTFDFNDLRKGQLPDSHMPIKNSHLLPCDTTDLPRTEYSHMITLQLHKVVHQQAEQIQGLEARLNEMETKIQGINDLHIEELEHRIQLQEDYNDNLQKTVIALDAKHMEDMKSNTEEKERFKHKITAIIEWCSQSVWTRNLATFILPKEPDDEFVSEC